MPKDLSIKREVSFYHYQILRMGLKFFFHYKRIHSATSIQVCSPLLEGCESLLLVDADATACPRPMEGLPDPVEALPGP